MAQTQAAYNQRHAPAADRVREAEFRAEGIRRRKQSIAADGGNEWQIRLVARDTEGLAAFCAEHGIDMPSVDSDPGPDAEAGS